VYIDGEGIYYLCFYSGVSLLNIFSIIREGVELFKNANTSFVLKVCINRKDSKTLIRVAESLQPSLPHASNPLNDTGSVYFMTGGNRKPEELGLLSNSTRTP
jgi:hypothetical protein